jgi:hypothetical protein
LPLIIVFLETVILRESIFFCCFTIALHFVYYNFVKLAAGITKRFMTIEDIANLATIEAPKKRGVYKKKELL